MPLSLHAWYFTSFGSFRNLLRVIFFTFYIVTYLCFSLIPRVTVNRKKNGNVDLWLAALVTSLILVRRCVFYSCCKAKCLFVSNKPSFYLDSSNLPCLHPKQPLLHWLYLLVMFLRPSKLVNLYICNWTGNIKQINQLLSKSLSILL